MQDQTNNGFSYKGTEFWLGSPAFSALLSADDIFGENTPTIASDINSSLAEYAIRVSEYSNGAVEEANVLAAF